MKNMTEVLLQGSKEETKEKSWEIISLTILF